MASPPDVRDNKAEDSDDDHPPGFEPDLPAAAALPDGNDGDTPASAAADKAAAGAASPAAAQAEADRLADALQHVVQLEPGNNNGDPPEEEDAQAVAQVLGEGLHDRPEAEISITTAEDRSIYVSAQKFEDLPISPELLKGLYVEMKFERPSRIQSETLPMILQPPFKDMIAQSHNGSGKTTCFVLAMLSRVDPRLREPQALCTCPTRELVVQNLTVLLKMGKYTGISAFSTASDTEEGGGYRRDAITEQVIIGTHGKLKSWTQKRLLNLDRIQILVFDEADDMLRADAFADDSVRLIRNIRKKNPAMQLLLFSATFNDTVKDFAMQIAPKANIVFVAKEELSLNVIAQFNVVCPDIASKVRVLKEMIFPNCESLGQTIIFVRSKDGARSMHSEMEKDGYKCTSITGDMQHSERDRVVQEFRSGITKVLISTDVLARGFDVSQVTLVINFDVPVTRAGQPDFESYLHRIGRSGRFGRKGVAFNLMCGFQDEKVMSAISKYYDRQIDKIEWDNEDAFLEALKAST